MRAMRQRKAIIEPSEAVKHFLFAALRPSCTRYFAFDAVNVIEIVPVVWGLELHARGAQIARALILAKGTGETTIGEKRFSWQRGDTLAAPCWYAITHLTTSDAQLFVLSDEPLLQFSNYYRFEALD